MRCNLLIVLLLATMVFMNGCATTERKVAEGFSPTMQHPGSQEIEMVPVKGGCYQMGDLFAKGREDEFPTHEVCVDDFSIGKYEVTQAQWAAVMGNNPSSFKTCGPDCPVENVTWKDVQEFIKRLNAKTGKNYRLPWEAEWEYAAREGGKPKMWAGVNKLSTLGDYAWFADNSEEKPHPVGSKEPNGLGIYDMTGNVWEFCADKYDAEYYKKSPKKNPQGPSLGDSHVSRGGSWASDAWNLRAAARGKILMKTRNDGLGLRLALPTAQ